MAKTLGIGIGLWCALGAMSALAQTPAPTVAPAAVLPEEVPRGQTVMSRPRPDFDPVGIRLGGFLLYPELGLRESYNSNIFATDRGEEGDFITSVEPSLKLQSNWNNHSLSFLADARIVRYLEESSENFEDVTLATAGHLDVSRATQIVGGIGYRIRHEDRSSPDDVGGREPVEYELYSANLGVRHTFNRLSIGTDGSADRYRYKDTAAFGGGTIDQSGRDRDQYTARLRVGYEISPAREVYVLGTGNERAYKASRDGSGFDRDSRGYEIALGLRYDIDGVFFIDGFVGFSQQFYEDNRLKTATGPSGAINVIWNTTRLTTVTASLSRQIEETTVSGSSSYFATKAEARVDHELLRNVILSGSLKYQNDDFEGAPRDDQYYGAALSAKYLMNRNVSLEGGYAFRTRDSNSPGADFDENIVTIRFVLRP